MNRIEPDWDLYRTFLAVMSEGSLSGAARALALTQPTVARHLDALEDTLGLELFIRTQRGLSPTAAALELQPFAETMASAAAAMQRAASGPLTEAKGTVRISASEVIAVEVLPPILAGLRRTHPGIVIELTASNLVENLLRRDADIAVRMVEPEQDALVVRRIGDIALGLYGHEHIFAGRKLPETFADLASFGGIGLDRDVQSAWALFDSYPDLKKVAFALKSDNHLVHLAAIRAGLGIGICQVNLARRNPALRRIMPDAFEPRLGVWTVMHENLRSTPRCRAVFDHLAAGLSDYVNS
jgi:DNA-binding transcriptional LysR family regulator